eukprot:CAMPEP_0194035566 /NCGR_PEP_ID=MMETSP0009_2-20130614/7971_1 /TAXON_ID=210454 /ORGANISM="Grammatophora oceanica, Strain CCMP 410" /LENGTH=49 /DNA_ID=CAMNT_0038676961 /DNA_START=42 /DNA_END=191 /DNA_ORIENTATION=-
MSGTRPVRPGTCRGMRQGLTWLVVMERLLEWARRWNVPWNGRVDEREAQ